MRSVHQFIHTFFFVCRLKRGFAEYFEGQHLILKIISYKIMKMQLDMAYC